MSKSTEFAKQLYLRVERREQVFFKFTFFNILFTCIQNKYLGSIYLEVLSYIFNFHIILKKDEKNTRIYQHSP